MHKAEIGLALGGGAARGLAHIGVLRELAAADVAVTHVAGCSFGAVVGAAYVCGTLAELEERVRSLTRAELIRYADATFAGGVLRGDALLNELSGSLNPAAARAGPAAGLPPRLGLLASAA